MLITLYGRVPSKKNGKRILMNHRTGQRFIGSSQDYMDWHEGAMLQLMNFTRGWIMSEQYEITCKFFPDTKAKFDLSNKFESVADALVDRGLLEDDNYTVLPKVTLLFGGIDKKEPRVEIEIINL